MQSHSQLVLFGAALLLSHGRCCDGQAADPRWAIALHGGASNLDPAMPAEQRAAYEQALTQALRTGADVLASGGSALDATQRVVMCLEDSPLFNAGRGAVFDRAGGHSMDAAIMDGRTLACGGVAAVATLRNPVHAARIVMEKSPHVILSGASAVRFCGGHGAATAPPSYFHVAARFERLRTAMIEQGLTPPDLPEGGWPPKELGAEPVAEEVGGTVGCVALDSHGALAAATSTGGRNAKMVGRIGDSPVPGAGNYADARVAVSGTGAGEEYLRYFIAGRVALLVELEAMTLDAAVTHCLEQVLKPGDGGLIAVGRDGTIVMHSTTGGMPRGAADSTGRFEVGIWFE